VIPRKDIPKVHVTFLPITEREDQGTPQAKPQEGPLTLKTKEFDDERARLVDQVIHAPERRIHNLITWLEAAARKLEMICRLGEAARKEHAAKRIRCLSLQGLWFLGLQSAVWLDCTKRLAISMPDCRPTKSTLASHWIFSPFSAGICLLSIAGVRLLEYQLSWSFEEALSPVAWERQFQETCRGPPETITSWEDEADRSIFNEVKGELSGILTQHIRQTPWLGWAKELVTTPDLAKLTSVFSNDGTSQVAAMRTKIMGLGRNNSNPSPEAKGESGPED